MWRDDTQRARWRTGTGGSGFQGVDSVDRKKVNITLKCMGGSRRRPLQIEEQTERRQWGEEEKKKKGENSQTEREKGQGECSRMVSVYVCTEEIGKGGRHAI